MQPRHLESRPIDSLRPAARNPRTHSRKQIRQIADSIQRFGFTNPILVDDDDRILAGHGRVAAARLLGLGDVPVIRLSGLSPAERRAYVLADNKLALNAGWDQELLSVELQELINAGFEVELTGFGLAEIDFIPWTPLATPSRQNGTSRGIACHRSALARSRARVISGNWAGTGYTVATPGERPTTRASLGRSGRGWCSPTHPTTSPSTAMSRAWAAFGTASSPWAWAR